jgi:uridine phosphorylase
VIEELAALGVKTIVGVGTAGGLSPDLEIGQTVVCSAAIRDEGTSHHYAPAGRWAVPDSDLLGALRATFPDAVVGTSWTTDAPYRETAEEISAYRAEGILTVDMEASAIFTVGALLGVQTASVFCISDVLHGEEWEPHFQSPSLADTLWRLFEAIESMLLSDGSTPHRQRKRLEPAHGGRRCPDVLGVQVELSSTAGSQATEFRAAAIASASLANCLPE